MSTPIAETEAIFARAYASAILSKLSIELGEHDAIYLSPIAKLGIAASDAIAPEVTNFQTFKLGDTLFVADNPSYTGKSADSYIHRLFNYLPWIDTGADRSEVVADRLKKAQDSANSVAQRYNDMILGAQPKFVKAKEEDPSLDFWTWIVDNAPEHANTEKERHAALQELNKASDTYYGPHASEVAKYTDSIKSALSQDPSAELNMAGVADPKIIQSIIKRAKNGESAPRTAWSHAVLQMPQYSIETYSDTVQAWIGGSSKGEGRDQILIIDVANGRNKKWEEFGFKKVHGDEDSALSPLFSFDTKVDDKTETHVLNIENKEDDIALELSMLGLQTFKVTPGKWDVPNVKTLFPKLLPGVPDFVDTKNLAKVTSVIVGYDIELKVTFKGDVGQEVSKLYEGAKNSSGSMRIFGVDISAGDGSDNFKTKFDEVQWDGNSGTMTIRLPPTQAHPTILAVLAEKLQ